MINRTHIEYHNYIHLPYIYIYTATPYLLVYLLSHSHTAYMAHRYISHDY